MYNRLSDKFSEKINYIILSFPIFIFSGPFLPDLCIVIISLYFVFLYPTKIIEFIKKDHIVLLLFFFLIYNIFNSFFSENISLSLKNSLFYLRFLFFIFGYAVLLNKYPNYLSFFQNVFIYFIIFLIVDASIQFFLGKNIFGLEQLSKNRISGIFGDEHILGSFLARFVPILISLYFFLKKNKKLTIFVILLTVWAVIITGERASLIILLLNLLLICLFVIPTKMLNRILIVLAFISIVFFGIMSNKFLKERIFILTIDQIKITFLKSKPQLTISHNQNFKHLVISWKMFIDKPINGYGNKMFPEICFKKYFIEGGYCSNHPHNYLAQVAVENGIIGLSFFFIILFLIIRKFLFFIKNSLSSNRHVISVLIIIFVNFFPLLPSGNFYNNLLSIMNFFPLAIYFYYTQYSKKS